MNHFLVILSLLVSMNLFANPTVTDAGRYIYISTPWHELSSKARGEAVDQAYDYIQENLDELLETAGGVEAVMEKPVNFIIKHQKEINNISENAGFYVQDYNPGFAAYQMLPSAIVVTFSAAKSSLFKLSVGGSFSIGLVIMPLSVKRIDKLDPKNVKEYLTFRGSVCIIPVANAGIATGIGGGGEVRVGFGLIFGNMSDPSDFYGITAGISGTATPLGHGLQMKVLWVQNIKTGQKFVLGNVAYVKGATKVAIHGNVGWIQPLTAFGGIVSKVTGEYVNRGSKEYKEIMENAGVPLRE